MKALVRDSLCVATSTLRGTYWCDCSVLGEAADLEVEMCALTARGWQAQVHAAVYGDEDSAVSASNDKYSLFDEDERDMIGAM